MLILLFLLAIAVVALVLAWGLGAWPGALATLLLVVGAPALLLRGTSGHDGWIILFTYLMFGGPLILGAIAVGALVGQSLRDRKLQARVRQEEQKIRLMEIAQPESNSALERD